MIKLWMALVLFLGWIKVNAQQHERWYIMSLGGRPVGFYHEHTLLTGDTVESKSVCACALRGWDQQWRWNLTRFLGRQLRRTEKCPVGAAVLKATKQQYRNCEERNDTITE